MSGLTDTSHDNSAAVSATPIQGRSRSAGATDRDAGSCRAGADGATQPLEIRQFVAEQRGISSKPGGASAISKVEGWLLSDDPGRDS
jgi:hypothetical protein